MAIAGIIYSKAKKFDLLNELIPLMK